MKVGGTGTGGYDTLPLATGGQGFRTPDDDTIRTRLKQPAVFGGRKPYDPALFASLTPLDEIFKPSLSFWLFI